MKTCTLSFAFFLVTTLSFAQSRENDICINFEQPELLNDLAIDTSSSSNTWQIGPPQKQTFNAANSLPNAIVTDTINPYPVNNTSSFVIKNLAVGGFYYGLEFFNGFYQVQSDSLNDYGRMEFSPDNGSTWVDMINDSAYSLTFYWEGPKPVLTGNSAGWKQFEMMLMDIGSAFTINYGDTILFRFTFTSDGTAESLDGLMYDDLCMYEMIEGITETRFKPLRTSIFPNPSSDHFTIDFENIHDDKFQLNVYNSESKLVFNIENVNGNQVDFYAIGLTPGIYYYKLTSCNRNQRGWGKFVVF